MMGCCVDRRAFDKRVAENRATPGYPRGCDDETCMNLPAGQACASCVHVERCVALFGVKPENTMCDFFPRRFRLRVSP